MTDPRTPETKRREAQLPDDLDQNPDDHAARSGHEGSEDAQLLAEAGQAEGDVGQPERAEGAKTTLP